MKQMAAVVIMFVRLPVEGQVKTRLAAGVGHQAACHFYKLCAEHIMRSCASVPGVMLVVQHSCKDSTESVAAWVHSTLQDRVPVSVIPQSPDPDLGAKMQAALQYQLQQPGVEKVVLTGSDIPDLSSDVITRTLNALDTHQAVFGPAVDGGYYLVGVKGPGWAPQLSQLFKGITWSTSAVLQQTLEAGRAAGVDVARTAQLPTLQDIDTVDDVRAWVQGRPDQAGAVSPDLQHSWTALTEYTQQLIRGLDASS